MTNNGSASARPRADFLVVNAAELVTCRGPAPRVGTALAEAGAIAGGSVAAWDGRIVAVGPECEVRSSIALVPGATVLDAQGGVVAPGFVDAHTHPVFAGYREDEFDRLLRGESYQDITAAGGGIRKTVRMTRAASDGELEALAAHRLGLMLRHGTTTAEAKSGYGLTLADELSALALIARLSEKGPLELVPTLLAAHALPPEFDGRREEYVDLVVEDIIPATAPLARFCDVFCDETAFTREESRRILEAGLAHGLRPRIHADEFTSSGGAELAAEVGAASADHLGGMRLAAAPLLASAGVTAVLLPGTLFFLGKRDYAPARALITAGVAVALGTDLNPGTSHTESMLSVLRLACLMMRMTLDEVLIASTLNAAWSLGVADRVGSLEEGKQADLVIHAVPNRYHLVYHYGVNHVQTVVKRGRVVVADGRLVGGSAEPAVL